MTSGSASNLWTAASENASRKLLFDVTVVAFLSTALRAVLFLVEATPLFTGDSEIYLHSALAWFLPETRPVGTGLFYRMALLFNGPLESILVAQAVVGVITSIVAYLLGRAVGLRRRFAIAAACVFALAPSSLLFERALLSESIAVLMSSAALLALSRAIRLRSKPTVLLASGIAVGAFFVRLALVSLLVLVPISIGLWWKGRRLVMSTYAVAVIVAGLVVYASGMAIQTADDPGGPHFAITHFDGLSVLALVADDVDCTDANQSPALRLQLCNYAEANDQISPRDVLWSPDGPIQEAGLTHGWPDTNTMARDLALEAIFNDPVEYVVDSLGRISGLLDATDEDGLTSYYPSPSDVNLGEFVAISFPSFEPPPPGTTSTFNVALSIWYRLRIVFMLGLTAALVVHLVSARSPIPVPGRLLLLYSGLTVLVALLSSYTAPRLLVPVEIPAIIMSTLLVQIASGRLRNAPKSKA